MVPAAHLLIWNVFATYAFYAAATLLLVRAVRAEPAARAVAFLLPSLVTGALALAALVALPGLRRAAWGLLAGTQARLVGAGAALFFANVFYVAVVAQLGGGGMAEAAWRWVRTDLTLAKQAGLGLMAAGLVLLVAA
jgi:hypothetical protein